MERRTIREYIRGQVWKQTAFVFGGGLTVVASTLLSRPHELMSREKAVASWVLMGAGFVAFVGGVIGTQFARCPKCSARLGSFGTQIAYGSAPERELCPYCGVSLDQPMPAEPKP
jgi:hypothetical protein